MSPLTLPHQDLTDLATLRGKRDFPAEQVRLNVSGDRNPIVELLLLDNALLTEALCKKFVFLSWRPGATVWMLLGHLLNELTPASLRAYALEIEKRHPRTGNDSLKGTDGQYVSRRDIRSEFVFCPTKLARLERLERLPSAVTLDHVKRALANNQVADLRTPQEQAPLSLLELLVSAKAISRFNQMPVQWSTRFSPKSGQVTIGMNGLDYASLRLAL